MLVLGQWMLMPHDEKKVYVPKPKDEGYKHSWFWRKLEGKYHRTWKNW